MGSGLGVLGAQPSPGCRSDAGPRAGVVPTCSVNVPTFLLLIKEDKSVRLADPGPDWWKLKEAPGPRRRGPSSAQGQPTSQPGVPTTRTGAPHVSAPLFIYLESSLLSLELAWQGPVAFLREPCPLLPSMARGHSPCPRPGEPRFPSSLAAEAEPHPHPVPAFTRCLSLNVAQVFPGPLTTTAPAVEQLGLRAS